jgi:hypothetical protein
MSATYTIQHHDNSVYAVVSADVPEDGIAIFPDFDAAAAVAQQGNLVEWSTVEDGEYYDANGPWHDAARYQDGRVVWSADERFGMVGGV